MRVPTKLLEELTKDDTDIKPVKPVKKGKSKVRTKKNLYEFIKLFKEKDTKIASNDFLKD